MTLGFTFSIPAPSGTQNFKLKKGESILFVGANGSGKTHLAVKIENDLGINAHRISAHRALTLNPSVTKISEKEATNGLRTGHAHKDANITNRSGHRWGNNLSVSLLNDFDRLIQLLFAEQGNVTLRTHQKVHAGNTDPVECTKFQKLIIIWDRLLPHRKLNITGDDITVLAPNSTSPYSAQDMSDGERAIFYLIGQTLCAAENSVIIFDEPELHIHRSIMSSLWDELEGARPDCAFIFISHDLEFVASRVGKKYVIRAYDNSASETWTIEEVPEETGFSEEVVTQILGSRKPILFVEGSGSSLDYAVYRNCYSGWTVMPRGRCEDVIHSVVTMRKNASLTRITCAGIVDADDYSSEEISYLEKLGIKVLAVSEVENLFALPSIAKAIGTHEGYEGAVLDEKLLKMKAAIIEHVQHKNNTEECVARYCRRRIDRVLKKIDLSDAATISDIATKYKTETEALNVAQIADTRRSAITKSIQSQSIEDLMRLYDNNKNGLISIVASHMKATNLKEFNNWIVRVLKNNSAPGITNAFKAALPTIEF
ncbi:MAG: AAA family ATPase [Pseudomonadota bacterium]